MTEKCVVCGLRWHVCRDKVIPQGGYVCPACSMTKSKREHHVLQEPESQKKEGK